MRLLHLHTARTCVRLRQRRAGQQCRHWRMLTPYVFHANEKYVCWGTLQTFKQNAGRGP